VIGFEFIRLLIEIQFDNADFIDLPTTLLDISIVTPTQDRYCIIAGLLHNCSGTVSDDSSVWIIRCIDGTWMSPSSVLEDEATGR
jgi:hypothetical protein